MKPVIKTICKDTLYWIIVIGCAAGQENAWIVAIGLWMYVILKRKPPIDETRAQIREQIITANRQLELIYLTVLKLSNRQP